MISKESTTDKFRGGMHHLARETGVVTQAMGQKVCSDRGDRKLSSRVLHGQRRHSEAEVGRRAAAAHVVVECVVLCGEE